MTEINSAKLQKLVMLLKELFRLDQPDLPDHAARLFWIPTFSLGDKQSQAQHHLAD